jgi:hypothetical protein
VNILLNKKIHVKVPMSTVPGAEKHYRSVFLSFQSPLSSLLAVSEGLEGKRRQHGLHMVLIG